MNYYDTKVKIRELKEEVLSRGISINKELESIEKSMEWIKNDQKEIQSLQIEIAELEKELLIKEFKNE